MWHRITLLLTWTSVVCHRELYHCGQVWITTSAALPQQDYHLHSATTQLLPLESTDCFVLFCFVSWVLQKWFSVIALHQIMDGWLEVCCERVDGWLTPTLPAMLAMPSNANKDADALSSTNREKWQTDRWTDKQIDSEVMDDMLYLFDRQWPLGDLWWC